MHTFEMTVTDAYWDALCVRADIEGSKRSNRSGVQSVMLHAVRPYLIQNGNKSDVLKLDDKAYAKHRGKG